MRLQHLYHHWSIDLNDSFTAVQQSVHLDHIQKTLFRQKCSVEHLKSESTMSLQFSKTASDFTRDGTLMPRLLLASCSILAVVSFCRGTLVAVAEKLFNIAVLGIGIGIVSP
jgi:hypothetical protein